MTEELRKFAQGLGDDDKERRKGYPELGEQLEKHADRLENRLHSFFTRALIVIAIIGFFTAVSLVGFGLVLNEQQNTQDQLKKLVVQNKKFANDIQQQRRDSIIDTCQAQNKRHDGSINALIKGSDEDQANAPNEAARKEIRRRRDVTIALLDALAPVEPCEEKADEAVKGG